MSFTAVTSVMPFTSVTSVTSVMWVTSVISVPSVQLLQLRQLHQLNQLRQLYQFSYVNSVKSITSIRSVTLVTSGGGWVLVEVEEVEYFEKGEILESWCLRGGIWVQEGGWVLMPCSYLNHALLMPCSHLIHTFWVSGICTMHKLPAVKQEYRKKPFKLKDIVNIFLSKMSKQVHILHTYLLNCLYL